MERRGALSISIACLLVALTVASDPRAGHKPAPEGSEHEASVRDASWAIGWRNTSTPTTEDTSGRGQPPREGGERVAEAKDYGGEVDGYEEELKAVAESHEAMSRDDNGRNKNASTPPLDRTRGQASVVATNFDSREVITVNDSDEDVASNEAISEETGDEYDREVAELLKYKKQRNPKIVEEKRTKTKRVPTVKKELSTQREILLGSNETQVPKSLVPPEDTLNGLKGEAETVQRRNAESSKTKSLEDSGYSSEDDQYESSKSKNPKKLKKRKDVDQGVVEDLKNLLSKGAVDEEQQRKLRELGASKKVRSEELLKLVAEATNTVERSEKLLLNLKEHLKLLESGDGFQGYTPKTTPVTSGETSEDPRKSRKKSKKRKKRTRQSFSTTTVTPEPATPPSATTTETPWQTTPVQWRLVAERFFGSPSQQDLQENGEKNGDSRHSTVQGVRTPAATRELVRQDKTKSSSKSFPSNHKPVLEDTLGELGRQRLARFGKTANRQAGRAKGHREFPDVYDRPEEPGTYVRFDRLSPASREFLRRHEEDYQNQLNVQPDYESPDWEFGLSRSWPYLPYGYRPSWKKEEESLLPMSPEILPWRQSQSDLKYWPRPNKFLPAEIRYRPGMYNEEDVEEEDPWQQPRMPVAWRRDRLGWPVKKFSKVSPLWQQNERAVKEYDREPSDVVWEKGKNRSELNRPSTKQDPKEKVILPQITMKTWNSLTSDPATWPHKLPGAKPWPKDENGKSYNPNADLVKKLGLDKQNGSWNKEEAEKSEMERKSKEEKQNRSFSTKESSKEEEYPQTETKYRGNSDKSNFSDYKAKSSDATKPWTLLAESKVAKDWSKSENMQNDDAKAWKSKSSWSSDSGLPKIQSVGAWVMAADQSVWKPYQIKPVESEESPRLWPKPVRRTDAKRSSKGSWADKVNDSWMDQSNLASWTDRTEPWLEKTGKQPSWKPESSWTSKTGDNNSWASKANGGSWSSKSKESWSSKENDDETKFNEDSWPAKTKEESWKPEDSWSRKVGEQNGWASKGELPPWHQKMNDEWNYGKGSPTGTWPPKWKQFAYHRVTAMPISKPGTTLDAASAKSKNAFVAVSAVSSPKYASKDDEARNEKEEQDRGGNQVQVGLERPMYAWKKEPGAWSGSAKVNDTGTLENQLETLGQIDFWWGYDENEKRLANSTTEAASTLPANATSTAAHRRGGLTLEGNETNRRTISMK